MARLREIDIQRQITDWLALDGWRGLRTDPCSDKARGKGFGELGMADYLYIRYSEPPTPTLLLRSHAQVLWVEHKRPGGEPTPHQWTWHRAERARGALTAIAGRGCDFDGSLDDFIRWYRFVGLVRRRGL